MECTRRRFVGAAGATVTGSLLAGCLGGSEGTGGGEERTYLPEEPNYRGWFDGVGNYKGTLDYRGESTVTVRVGVEGGIGYYKYSPPAIAISPGTEVVWEWTGNGGAHNVVAEEGQFDSGKPVDAVGKTFSHTFESPAIYRYVCEPHVTQGMKGAVFVGLGQPE